MTTRMKISMAVAITLCVAIALTGSTINGIANQIISGLTQYGVVIGGGTGDLTTANPGTAGWALASNGSSAAPSFQQVPNAGLVNSSVTLNTTGPLTGGGAVSLGGLLTLACPTCTVAPAVVTSTTPGATPAWTLANGDIAWTLSANATAAVTVASTDKGVQHSAQICQPASGGPYTFAWPSNVHGGITIGTTASKCSVQEFESLDGVNLYALTTGVINQ